MARKIGLYSTKGSCIGLPSLFAGRASGNQLGGANLHVVRSDDGHSFGGSNIRKRAAMPTAQAC